MTDSPRDPDGVSPRDARTPPRRPDASMTLLNEILERPLDPGYAAAAKRRSEAGQQASTGERSVLFTVSLLVVGLLVGVSASTLRTTATARAEGRSVLVSQIEAGRDARDTKAATITALTADIAERDALILSQDSAKDSADLKLYGLTTGATAAEGPGFVVTVDDASSAAVGGTNSDPRAGTRAEDGIVRARDLVIIVNGLWAAGAEAIMINDQRLTATSAIRSAGQAVLVNYRPLVRPYTISAIGDPAALPARFAEGGGGAYAATLKSNFGIQVDTRVATVLVLPAAPSVQTRLATPVDTGPTPSPQSSPAAGGADE